jgi:hypothetical protein
MTVTMATRALLEQMVHRVWMVPLALMVLMALQALTVQQELMEYPAGI